MLMSALPARDLVSADELEVHDRAMSGLNDLNGTSWAGRHELWLDPLGDEVTRGDCTISVGADVVGYTWESDGATNAGSITLRDDEAEFVDTWHQPEPMHCRLLPNGRALFQAEGEYGPDSGWGWRIGLVRRTPTDELVLQMTNIAPWGEETRAVRMTCTRNAWSTDGHREARDLAALAPRPINPRRANGRLASLRWLQRSR